MSNSTGRDGGAPTPNPSKPAFYVHSRYFLAHREQFDEELADNNGLAIRDTATGVFGIVDDAVSDPPGIQRDDPRPWRRESTAGDRPGGWVEERFTLPRSAMVTDSPPLVVQAGMWRPIFTMSNRFTAPFVTAFEDATTRLLPIAFRYAFPAINRRLNSRQRRRLARALRRQIDATALRILATGK